MMYYGFDGGILGNIIWGLTLLLHLALPILLIAGSIWLVIDLLGRRKNGNHRSEKGPMTILQERYAKGELNRDDYIKMKEELT